MGGIEPGAMPWKNKWIGNPVLSFLGGFLFNIPLKDFHCGLRGYTKSAFLEMDLRTTGMEFASEMIIKANVKGMLLAEVPTTLSIDGRSRKPHLRPWRDGWRHLRFMLSLSPKWMFFVPGIVALLSGLFGFIPLLFGNVPIGPVSLGINSLLISSSLITLGTILIIFGVAVRVFAAREGLLPLTRTIKRLLKQPIYEFGALMGLLLIAAGAAIFLGTLNTWAGYDFGDLPPELLIRRLALAGTVLNLGVISVAGSLLFAFLSLPMRGAFMRSVPRE
jgi:hypothetical protein